MRYDPKTNKAGGESAETKFTWIIILLICFAACEIGSLPGVVD